MREGEFGFFSCQACNSKSLKLLSFLGYLPPVNDLRMQNSLVAIHSYPLPFCICNSCGLVQLGIELEKEVVFPTTYPYLSGMTRSLVENFNQQSVAVNKVLNLTKEDYVVDIGSNDGSLLKQYQSFTNVVGVEPTNAADIANKNNIPTIKSYFNDEVVDEILKTYNNPRIVTACNVFAHIPNLSDLLINIKKLIGQQGVFVSESHYLMDLLENLQFDTIYHEHLRYYDVTFLTDFFSKNGLNVFRVDRINSHGGSIRVWASASEKFGIESSVTSLITFEKEFKSKLINSFPSRVDNWRDEFRSLISSLKIKGSKIGALGAPSRASTLVSFSGLTDLDLVAVGELPGSAKIGKFMPGTKIPIVDENEILSSEPPYLLILSWHLSGPIIKNIKAKGYKGKFIIPLPSPEIIQ